MASCITGTRLTFQADNLKGDHLSGTTFGYLMNSEISPVVQYLGNLEKNTQFYDGPGPLCSMIQKVKGIVLHHVKYKETSAILYLYTDLYGRQTYLINSIRGKKSRFSGSLLQSLTFLELEAYHREGRDLQRVKELWNYIPFRSIPFDMHKNTQALFIAEVLYRALREEEPNKELFGFLESSIQVLDISEKGMVNFHLLFLVKLSKYLGILPENNYGVENGGFDMRNGQFSDGSGMHADYFDQNSSDLLFCLLNSGFGDLGQLSVKQDVRIKFLKNILDYFSIHNQGFGGVKSLSVLNEIYDE